MKILLILLGCLFICSGCKDDPSHYESTGESIYFPLDIGNEWIYERTNHDTALYTTRVIGQETFGNRKYFKVIHFDNFSNDTTIEFFRLKDGNKVYAYINSKEVLKFDFTGKDTISRLDTVTFDNKVTLSAGNFNHCIIIGPKNGVDGGMRYTFAPKIGLIYKWFDYYYDLEIIHVKIKGEQLF